MSELLNSTDYRVYKCQVFKETFNEQDNFSWNNLQPHHIAWIIAAVCVFISSVLSFYLIHKHFQYYRRPEQQRHIIRILLMVPIYAISSFLSLRFFDHAVYFDAIRSCYEAFVIYSFYSLLLNYLGPDHATQKAALQKKPDGKYPFPFNCFYYNPRSGGFLKACSRGCLQYALIHPITSLIEVIMELNGTLCPDDFDSKHPMLYLTGIEMTSVMIAMYFLVLFYLIVRDEVVRHRPILKFLAVKFVLFFSFWQSVVLSMLGAGGLLHESSYFTVANLSSQIQNFLICLEMLIASIMHIYCFGIENYEGERTQVSKGLKEMILPVDLLHDTKNAMQMKRKQKGDRIRMNSLNGGKSEISSAKNSFSKTSVINPSNSGNKSEKNSISTKSENKRKYNHSRQVSDPGDMGEEVPINLQKGTSDEKLDSDHSSIETNSDVEVNEIDEEMDGVGIIRMNPKIQFEYLTSDHDLNNKISEKGE